MNSKIEQFKVKRDKFDKKIIDKLNENFLIKNNEIFKKYGFDSNINNLEKLKLEKLKKIISFLFEMTWERNLDNDGYGTIKQIDLNFKSRNRKLNNKDIKFKTLVNINMFQEQVNKIGKILYPNDIVDIKFDSGYKKIQKISKESNFKNNISLLEFYLISDLNSKNIINFYKTLFFTRNFIKKFDKQDNEIKIEDFKSSVDRIELFFLLLSINNLNLSKNVNKLKNDYLSHFRKFILLLKSNSFKNKEDENKLNFLIFNYFSKNKNNFFNKNQNYKNDEVMYDLIFELIISYVNFEFKKIKYLNSNNIKNYNNSEKFNIMLNEIIDKNFSKVFKKKDIETKNLIKNYKLNNLFLLLEIYDLIDLSKINNKKKLVEKDIFLKNNISIAEEVYDINNNYLLFIFRFIDLFDLNELTKTKIDLQNEIQEKLFLNKEISEELEEKIESFSKSVVDSLRHNKLKPDKKQIDLKNKFREHFERIEYIFNEYKKNLPPYKEMTNNQKHRLILFKQYIGDLYWDIYKIKTNNNFSLFYEGREIYENDLNLQFNKEYTNKEKNLHLFFDDFYNDLFSKITKKTKSDQFINNTNINKKFIEYIGELKNEYKNKHDNFLINIENKEKFKSILNEFILKINKNFSINVELKKILITNSFIFTINSTIHLKEDFNRYNGNNKFFFLPINYNEDSNFVVNRIHKFIKSKNKEHSLNEFIENEKQYKDKIEGIKLFKDRFSPTKIKMYFENSKSINDISPKEVLRFYNFSKDVFKDVEMKKDILKLIKKWKLNSFNLERGFEKDELERMKEIFKNIFNEDYIINISRELNEEKKISINEKNEIFFSTVKNGLISLIGEKRKFEELFNFKGCEVEILYKKFEIINFFSKQKEMYKDNEDVYNKMKIISDKISKISKEKEGEKWKFLFIEIIKKEEGIEYKSPRQIGNIITYKNLLDFSRIQTKDGVLEEITNSTFSTKNFHKFINLLNNLKKNGNDLERYFSEKILYYYNLNLNEIKNDFKNLNSVLNRNKLKSNISENKINILIKINGLEQLKPNRKKISIFPTFSTSTFIKILNRFNKQIENIKNEFVLKNELDREIFKSKKSLLEELKNIHFIEKDENNNIIFCNEIEDYSNSKKIYILKQNFKKFGFIIQDENNQLNDNKKILSIRDIEEKMYFFKENTFWNKKITKI